MVFNSVPRLDSHQRPSQPQSQHQTPIRNTSMASSTFSAKSQPLHNFSLTDLKWSMNHATPHRIRSHKSPQRSADADHSLIKTAAFEPENDKEDHHHSQDHHRHSKSYHSLPSSDRKILSGEEIEFSKKDKREEEKGGGGIAGGADGLRTFPVEKATASSHRSKILLRFKSKAKVDDDSNQQHTQLPPINAQVEVVEAPVVESSPTVETEELVPRVWNLRPRKPVPMKPNNSNGVAPSSNKGESSSATAGQKRNGSDAKAEENNEEAKKKKMMKLWIPLMKGEIEEDFIALTGSKPPRRPKKRSRAVQKQLDFVFPGLWLSSITPDSYKVAANDKKG